ncbi:hypothetical protein [Anaerocolumna aminovalerica]|uniref:hypothetical protein n=1 Tax=Anaerocolumna aminovalerica TaxID=1527 RepID=UPI000BE42BD4|nr:hypothetical protein [Anaerocolumna aminovalerica]
MSKIIEEIQKAKDNSITVPKELNNRDVIRGIYGIFSQKNDEKICLYIGRSYSIADRLFGSAGHITMYNNDNYEKLVPKLILDSINNGCCITIEILEVVEYEGDNYYRDMQRLAYAEIRLIEEYQEKNECLKQLPEGTWISEDNWNKRYKIE